MTQEEGRTFFERGRESPRRLSSSDPAPEIVVTENSSADRGRRRDFDVEDVGRGCGKDLTTNASRPSFRGSSAAHASDGRQRHYSVASMKEPRGKRDSLSVRLASTYKSARCTYRSNNISEKIAAMNGDVDAGNDHVEIDAGEPPPADESLFFDNFEALRDAQRINGSSLRSAMWSIVSVAEIKLLLNMEKLNTVPEFPGNDGDRLKNVAYIWACYRGLAYLLPKLEESGARFDYVEPRTGINSILAASLSGNVSCLEYLIKKGADVNYENPTNHYTPLHLAAIGHSTAAINLLMDAGAKLRTSSCDDVVEPVLHCAIRARALEVVKLLLNRGASVAEKSHRGETPLHVACFVQSVPCAELLLLTPGTSVNAVDRSLRTPLHFTVMNNDSSAELVELLLKHGALVNAADKIGFTPLHIAALNEQSTCVDALIWAGADVSATTNTGLSALNVILRKIPESLQVFRQRLDASIRLRRPVSHNREFEMRNIGRICSPIRS